MSFSWSSQEFNYPLVLKGSSARKLCYFADNLLSLHILIADSKGVMQPIRLEHLHQFTSRILQSKLTAFKQRDLNLVLCWCPLYMLGVLCNTLKTDRDFCSGSKFGYSKDFFSGAVASLCLYQPWFNVCIHMKFHKNQVYFLILAAILIPLISDLFPTVPTCKS